MTGKQLIDFLKEKKPAAVRRLFAAADRVRKEHVGDAVHLRGVIEFSNCCRQDCLYCGLRRSNQHLTRYRMGYPEILKAAQQAARLGIRTIVLQSGEDPQYTVEGLCPLIEKIKKLNVAVTLSIGELSFRQYRQLKNAGADRYLLKFETSGPALYRRLRPGCLLANRLRCLEWLRKLGYETGSGIMVGLPGQSRESIAGDIMLFKKLGLDMIGIGPFIPHPHTPLSGQKGGDLQTVLKAVALARIEVPCANIPATTAVGTIDATGRQQALQAGANIIMPNVTPARYRKLYEIYPDKICVNDNAAACRVRIRRMIRSLGRCIGAGYGARPDCPRKKSS